MRQAAAWNHRVGDGGTRPESRRRTLPASIRERDDWLVRFTAEIRVLPRRGDAAPHARRQGTFECDDRSEVSRLTPDVSIRVKFQVIGRVPLPVEVVAYS